MAKCDHCRNQAKFSVCSVVSTLGETPRRQQSSIATRLCLRCMQLMSQDPPRIPRRLFERVNEAFQALAGACSFASGPESKPSPKSKQEK